MRNCTRVWSQQCLVTATRAIAHRVAKVRGAVKTRATAVAHAHQLGQARVVGRVTFCSRTLGRRLCIWGLGTEQQPFHNPCGPECFISPWVRCPLAERQLSNNTATESSQGDGVPTLATTSSEGKVTMLYRHGEGHWERRGETQELCQTRTRWKNRGAQPGGKKTSESCQSAVWEQRRCVWSSPGHQPGTTG